ncbi:MAG: GTP-binding protein [Oscillospiraceae bacterium]|nr:GTP-binding protein [Oscillospiraceae bacterium]
MKFKKFIALICTFAFIWPNFTNVSAADDDDDKKVVFVGDSKTGKSEVRKGMVGESFSDDYAPTIGVRVVKHNILEIWDTDGNELHRSLVSLYARNAVIVVIFIPHDVTVDSVKDYVRYWKDEVVSSGTEVVLAVSKWDLETRDDTFRRELKNVARSLGINNEIFYMSAKTGVGIDEFIKGLPRIANKNKSPLTVPAASYETPSMTNAPIFGKEMLIALRAVGVGVVGMIGYFAKNWFGGNHSQNSPDSEARIS